MFGNKIQKKEDLPYGWLTHWKWATMVAKTRPVRVTRGGWCNAWLTRRFFKACAIAPFRNQFAHGQKTVGSHLKWLLMQCRILLVIHNWIQGNLEGESGVLSARFSKGFRFKSLSTNKLLVVITVYEFQIVETYVCQSFQTLYEASPIINVTHRSFAVFHPIMYVTHRSFAAPAPATRDFFWLYHTYSLLRGGFYNASSGFGLWAKTLRGQLN